MSLRKMFIITIQNEILFLALELIISYRNIVGWNADFLF